LPEASLLSELGVNPDDEVEIELVASKYTQRTALAHFATMRSLFSSASAHAQTQWSLLSAFDSDAVLAEVDPNNSESSSSSSSSNNNNNEQQSNATQNGDASGGKKKKQRKRKAKPVKTQVLIPDSRTLDPKFATKPITSEHLKLSDYFPSRGVSIECVKSLTLSNFNPPPAHRLTRGDFAYIQLETLEGQVFHITASYDGFFVNQSRAGKFDHRPVEPSIQFHDLVSLAKHVCAELFRACTFITD
jgi:protein TIF31